MADIFSNKGQGKTDHEYMTEKGTNTAAEARIIELLEMIEANTRKV